MNPKIVSEEPISMYTLKRELGKLKKKEDDMNIRAKKTEEYLNNFATLKADSAEELAKKLLELNVPRMKEQHVHKLVDVLPENVEELKVVLQGYALTISKENMQKIVDTILPYVQAS